jgi:hypothetical protein
MEDMHGGGVPEWLVAHLSTESEDQGYAWRICRRGRTKMACNSPVN